MIPHPGERGQRMRSENRFRCDGRVVEEAIGGLGLAPGIAGAVDTGFGVGRQCFEESLAASVQTSVSKVDAAKFVGKGAGHRFARREVGHTTTRRKNHAGQIGNSRNRTETCV